MKYIIDHDLHIHSKVSFCSRSPEQTPERILQYGLENGYKKICITDHFWDKDAPLNVPHDRGYKVQTSEYIQQSLPLPQAEGIEFLFGGESDIDLHGNIGITDKFLEKLDFLIVPTSHLHLSGFASDPKKLMVENYKILDTEDNIKYVAEAWVNRFDKLLSADLPYHKVGAAHLTWLPFISLDSVVKAFELISDETLIELFNRAAKLKIGIEINAEPSIEKSMGASTLRVFKTAKECGCKFYFGSDAHTPGDFFGRKEKFEELADWIGLTEDDKFEFVK